MALTMEQILNNIISICLKIADVDEIILYGSRAKGTHMPKSDIDIAIIADYLDIEEIKEEIDEIDTLLTIDLLDYNNCKNLRLIEEINQYGTTLYRTT